MSSLVGSKTKVRCIKQSAKPSYHYTVGKVYDVYFTATGPRWWVYNDNKSLTYINSDMPSDQEWFKEHFVIVKPYEDTPEADYDRAMSIFI